MGSNLVFAIFVNDERKLFHIRSTMQDNYIQNVNVSNAYSKAKYELDGKNNTRTGTMESFQWYIYTSGPAAWRVDQYVELGAISSEQQRTQREHWNSVMEDQGYRNCSPSCNYVHADSIRKDYNKRSGVNNFWNSKKLDRPDMTQPKIRDDYIVPMMDACEVDPADIPGFAQMESKEVYLKSGKNGHLENVGDLWRYIYENYYSN
jgi:hypothetical protein